jgi:hypothetical protein
MARGKAGLSFPHWPQSASASERSGEPRNRTVLGLSIERVAWNQFTWKARWTVPREGCPSIASECPSEGHACASHGEKT